MEKPRPLIEVLIASAQLTRTLKVPPLHAACQADNAEMLRYRLDAGADVDDSAAKDGWTPLIVASLLGHVECVDALLEANATVDKMADDGSTALVHASRTDNFECAQALIDAGADVDLQTNTGWTPLVFACWNGGIRCARSLVAAGSDLHKPCRLNWLAADHGWTALTGACLNGHVNCVDVLVGAGVDVDQAKSDGRTALMVACSRGEVLCVRALLDANADVDKVDHAGENALLIARRGDSKDVLSYDECALALLESMAAVGNVSNSRDRAGALQTACARLRALTPALAEGHAFGEPALRKAMALRADALSIVVEIARDCFA